MGILKNNKKNYCVVKQNKKDKQDNIEGWITSEETCHIINVLKEYINETYYTKEEMDKMLGENTKSNHVPKKVTNLINSERRIYFKEEQVNQIIESIKDYINLHYVTKVEAEMRFKEFTANKENIHCSGGCCVGKKFEDYSKLIFKENISDDERAERAELKLYLETNFDKLSETYKDKYQLLNEIRKNNNMSLSDKREWWGMIDKKSMTLNKFTDEINKKFKPNYFFKNKK